METPKWLIHSYKVAERMYEIGKEEGSSEKECRNLWLIGLLHDIGKRFGEQSEHREIGAEILEQNKIPFTKVIKQHGQPLETFTWALYYLNKADMTVNQEGEIISYSERLKDIAERYGEDSDVYNNAKEVVRRCKKYDIEYEIPEFDIITDSRI